jgi:hypothetical protein
MQRAAACNRSAKAVCVLHQHTLIRGPYLPCLPVGVLLFDKVIAHRRHFMLAPQEYNTEAAFAAAVLLSFLALFTLVVKGRLEGAVAEETTSK